jgi:hypothetical protein
LRFVAVFTSSSPDQGNLILGEVRYVMAYYYRRVSH